MLTLSIPLMRKPSNLSNLSNLLNFSAMRNLFLRPDSASLFHSDSSSLKPAQSHMLDSSDASSRATMRGDNYRLTKVSTSESLDSAFSSQTQFRVTLNLSAREISLLRYTWNRMLIEEPVYEQQLLLPIPGSMWASAKDKPLPLPRQSLGALLTFCTQLYLNLLTMDPDLEEAFPSLRHQAVSMAGVMSFAINSLENLASLDDYLIELGKRHLRILGIEPFQFEMMGEALIQTFVERFGTRFTHELEILWIKFYLYLANSLIQFGLDPVLRLSTQVYGRTGVYTESMFSADTDSASALNSRRMSTSTAMTSLVSQKPAQEPVKNASKQASGAKKKKKFGRKSDCVVM